MSLNGQRRVDPAVERDEELAAWWRQRELEAESPTRNLWVSCQNCGNVFHKLLGRCDHCGLKNGCATCG